MIDIDIQKQLHGASGDMDLSIDLHIKKGEFIALMGESGSGKTTLLRILAGLENAEGNIRVDGKSWNKVSPQERDIGFVFQDYALFDNMTVEENLLFVNDNLMLASELLEMTELSTLKARNVIGLSGGQKQRVALCRAMMKKPKILLMDEPLSALDVEMRTKLQKDIKKLHKRFNMTTVIVSHDSSDVFALCTRVLSLKQGKIVADGSPKDVLVTANQYYKAQVLDISVDNKGTSIASVALFGKVLEVVVLKNVKVGQYIEMSLHGKIV